MKGIKNLCRLFTKYLPIWTIGLSILGYKFPQILTWISKDMINYFFALTMFGIGLTLDIDVFLPDLRKPIAVLLGNLTQFIVMPTLGFLIGSFFEDTNIRVGFILVGAVPGAMASNVISYLAKADVAYSVLMTTFATLIAPILTPTITKLLVGAEIHVKFSAMALQVLWITVIPILAGLFTRRNGKKYVEPLEPIASALAALAIVVICAYIIAINKSRLALISIWIFIGVIVVNALGMVFGYLAGILFKMEQKRKRTLSFEIGMQNAGLGAVLALNNFEPSTALPCALFATWCVITASLFANIWAKSRKS